MRPIIFILLVAFIFGGCLKKRRKKEYSKCIGTYECEIYEYDKKNGNIWDSTYYGQFNLIEMNSSTMLFLGMEIPYKYIDEEGVYEQSSLEQGSYSGRQITFAGDTIVYVEYNVSSGDEYEKRFTGKKEG